MPKTLSEGQQRFVFAALVVVLVAFGIYLSVRGTGEDSDQEAEPQGAGQSGDADNGADDGAPATTPPSPIPQTAVEDMEVLSWLPLSEGELKAAAATAQGFAQAYGSIDYSAPQEEYFASLEELAADDYADALAQSSGAGALWDEMAEKETVSEGRADVQSIRSFSENSVVFVVKTQSIVEDEDGTSDDLGDFAVTVQKSGGEWQVYDFQPAGAGNLGGER